MTQAQKDFNPERAIALSGEEVLEEFSVDVE